MSFTETGVSVMEGPLFAGKSTVLAELIKNYSNRVIVVPESCDWVGGNRNFPSIRFQTVGEAKKSTHFFIELERKRCEYALEMRQKTGLPVVMDRTSTLSTIMIYKLIKERFPGFFSFGGVFEYGVEAFQQAINDGKIFLPDRLIVMSPENEETFRARLSRGTALGPLTHWNNIEFIVGEYRKIANRGFSGRFQDLKSANGQDSVTQNAKRIVAFLEADLPKGKQINLFDLFGTNEDTKLSDTTMLGEVKIMEINKQVIDLIKRAKSEYRKISEGVVIRPVVTIEDAQAFKNIVLSVLKHEWDFEYDPKFGYDLDHPLEVYGKGNGKCFILENHGTIVGTMAVEDRGNGLAHWKRLTLLPEFRSKGWGLEMNKLMITYCKSRGFKRVEFDTLKNTGMWKKYIEKWGCKIVKEEREGDNIKVYMSLNLENSELVD